MVGYLLVRSCWIRLCLPLNIISGNACRLAIDLGLHRNPEQLTSVNLSPKDITVRKITYLGCLVYDR